VFKARNEETAQLAAVKIVPVEQDTGEVAREIETLRQCESPNIVQYYGSATKDGELWIIMEFCAGSSLCDVMEARGKCLSEGQIAATIAGTLQGLEYLHERGHIHRDVKAGNLLLDSAGVIKLADFGVSAQIGSTLSRRGTVIGTPFWMAPEVISGGPLAGYDTKVRPERPSRARTHARLVHAHWHARRRSHIRLHAWGELRMAARPRSGARRALKCVLTRCGVNPNPNAIRQGLGLLTCP
jgi:serine/threonine protein kinase